jgi:hypothetical protein
LVFVCPAIHEEARINPFGKGIVHPKAETMIIGIKVAFVLLPIMNLYVPRHKVVLTVLRKERIAIKKRNQ